MPEEVAGMCACICEVVCSMLRKLTLDAVGMTAAWDGIL